MTMTHKLWYKTPASEWKHGLLYSAKYKDRECSSESLQYLPKIRSLLLEGKYAEATRLANRK